MIVTAVPQAATVTTAVCTWWTVIAVVMVGTAASIAVGPVIITVTAAGVTAVTVTATGVTVTVVHMTVTWVTVTEAKAEVFVEGQE